MRVAVAVAVLMLMPALVFVGFQLYDGDEARVPIARTGVLRISQPADFRSTDPALAQGNAWELEYATCAKLYNYDARGRLVPELAASRRGAAFRVRSGWRFSDGRRVEAADVAWTIRRVLDRRMVSPGATYLRDVRSVRARGDEVQLVLSQPVPDLADRLALPYFCVVPRDTPIDPRGVDEPVTAGPYFIAARSYRRNLLLARNPYYRGSRQRGPEQIAYTFGAFPAQVTLQLRNGETDYGPIPSEELGALAQIYGLNKERLHIARQPALAYLALNTERPLFKDNPRLRQAVNYALDRRVLTAVLGARGGEPTDQLLTPGTPGFRDEQIYPLDGPDLAKARELARGNLRDGVASYWTCSEASCRTRAEAVQAALAKIGLKVRIRVLFGPGVAERRVAQRGERFDITDAVWRPEYPDPYGFLERLVSGRALRRTENTNLSFFYDPALDRRLDRFSRLSGEARYRAFGALDVDVTRRLAPIAPYATLNARAFFSARVGCVRFHPLYGVDLAGLCFRNTRESTAVAVRSSS